MHYLVSIFIQLCKVIIIILLVVVGIRGEVCLRPSAEFVEIFTLGRSEMFLIPSWYLALCLKKITQILKII